LEIERWQLLSLIVSSSLISCACCQRQTMPLNSSRCRNTIKFQISHAFTVAVTHFFDAQAQKTLGQLKIAMTSIPSLFGAPADSSSPAHFAQETQIVLDAFELGAFLSLKVGDMNSFERHIAQAKTIYFDYKLVIPEPKNQAVLTGLHLMHLLSQTRIAEFHTALETVSPSLQSHPCIQVSHLRHHHPTSFTFCPVPREFGAVPDGGRVPQDSAVARLHSLPSIPSVPRHAGVDGSRRYRGIFPVQLSALTTFRYSISLQLHFIYLFYSPQDCAEDAYVELSVTHASRLLMFSNQQEFLTCVGRAFALARL
jgi:hypothetical protein